MRLLADAGLAPVEVLQSATSKTAEAFGIDGAGKLDEGETGTMVLVKGRPDKNIDDSMEIAQVWVDGKPILRQSIE
jgi:imidazolonepropionase-like amidohydrolase